MTPCGRRSPMKVSLSIGTHVMYTYFQAGDTAMRGRSCCRGGSLSLSCVEVKAASGLGEQYVILSLPPGYVRGVTQAARLLPQGRRWESTAVGMHKPAFHYCSMCESMRQTFIVHVSSWSSRVTSGCACTARQIDSRQLFGACRLL